MLGSILSFHCGALLCRRDLGSRLPARFHAPLHKAQRALQKRGLPCVRLAFLAVMRYTVPLVAGMLKLPLGRVYATAALSAAARALTRCRLRILFPHLDLKDSWANDRLMRRRCASAQPLLPYKLPCNTAVYARSPLRSISPKNANFLQKARLKRRNETSTRKTSA